MQIIVSFIQIVIFFLLPVIANAQTTTVPIRAGEHADFTRLALQIPQANTWQVVVDRMTVSLTVEGPPLDFDLSQTFSKIPRTRLRNATATKGNLKLLIGCLCEIKAYEDIPQMLIIDILGNQQSTVFSNGSAIRPPERPVHIVRPASSVPQRNVRAGINLANEMRGLNTDSDIDSSLALLMLGNTRGKSDVHSLNETHEKPKISTLTREQIAQELGRIIAGSVAEDRLIPRTDLFRASEPQSLASAPTGLFNHAVMTHLGQPGDEQLQNETFTAESNDDICHNLSLLDFGGWISTEQSNHKRFAFETLYGEFDRFDADRGAQLLRHYLTLGFGAEARLASTLLDLPASLSEMSRAIGFILDMETVPEPNALRGLQECGPEGALWSFLSSDSNTNMTGFPFEVLVQAVDALPPHLRAHLGTAILTRLTALGENNTALMIESSLDRVLKEHTDDLQLAKIALASLDVPSSYTKSLEDTLSPETSDDALIYLLSRRDTENMTVDADLLTLAKSRRMALRGDPRSGKLTLLLARALARNRNYSEAFGLAKAWDAGLTKSEMIQLFEYLFGYLTEHASDSEFILTIFEQEPWKINYLTPQLRDRLAQRLRGLGFTEQAYLLQRFVDIFPDPRPSVSPDSSLAWDMMINALVDTPEVPMRADDAENLRRAREIQAKAQERAVDGLPDDIRRAGDISQDPVELQTQRTSDTELGALNEIGAVDPYVINSTDAFDPEKAPRSSSARILAETREVIDQSSTLRSRIELLLSEKNIR